MPCTPVYHAELVYVVLALKCGCVNLGLSVGGVSDEFHCKILTILYSPK